MQVTFNKKKKKGRNFCLKILYILHHVKQKNRVKQTKEISKIIFRGVEAKITQI